jgi:hypothetical protein
LNEEKLEFTRPFLIIGNLALLTWVFLAFFAEWFYNQVYGYLLLLLTATAIYIILRRLGCSSCYNCKSCTSGLGRLVGVFFGTGNIKKGSVGNRLGLVGFIYFLLFPLPTLLVAFSLTAELSVLKVLVLACLLAVSVYSFSTWAEKAARTKTTHSTIRRIN